MCVLPDVMRRDFPSVEASPNVHRLPTADPPPVCEAWGSATRWLTSQPKLRQILFTRMSYGVRLDGGARGPAAAGVLGVGIGRVGPAWHRPGSVETGTGRGGARLRLGGAPRPRGTRAFAGRNVRVEIVRWGLDLDRYSPGDRAAARGRWDHGRGPSWSTFVGSTALQPGTLARSLGRVQRGGLTRGCCSRA